MISLIIKGPPVIAIEAMKQRGLESEVPVKEGRTDFSQCLSFASVQSDKIDTVMRWYGEPAECREDVGYPDGTLLLFRHQGLSELI